MNAPPDFNTRVSQYIALRDKIKELDEAHKDKMKPYRETLETLNGCLLQHLDSVAADNVKTPSGTVYRSTKKSASVADRPAFWAWVSTQGDWDLLDWKANVTAVEEHIKNNNQPPPGVNFSTHFEVGVRRASKTE